MIKGLRTVVYAVGDMEKAKQWYAQVFGVQPYFEEPFYVGFTVGGFELGLIPDGCPGKQGPVAYWGVDDIEQEVARITALGATVDQPVQDVGQGVLIAQLADPFGNSLGLVRNPHFDLSGRPLMKTFAGSCHCGAIRFEADIDLSKGTVRCNCSLCTKLRCWPAIVKPADFRLLQGAGEMTVYRCNTMTEQHLFCRQCGVRPYGIGTSPRWGDYYAVSVNCLDNISAEEFASAPVTYLDGKNDNFGAAPAYVRNL